MPLNETGDSGATESPHGWSPLDLALSMIEADPEVENASIGGGWWSCVSVGVVNVS